MVPCKRCRAGQTENGKETSTTMASPPLLLAGGPTGERHEGPSRNTEIGGGVKRFGPIYQSWCYEFHAINRVPLKGGPQCCRQGQTEVVSNSSNKIHQTWGTPFSRALWSRKKGVQNLRTSFMEDLWRRRSRMDVFLEAQFVSFIVAPESN